MYWLIDLSILRKRTMPTGGDTTVAVNVAPQQFCWEGLVNCVRSALRDSGLPPHRLELEVTETAMLNDSEKMLAVLHTLRAMNVRLSMDDFGTGYSALNYLQKFPFSKIKIGQSFVRDLASHGESNAIGRAVANLGTNLGIATIAEGVETEDQAKIVLSANCQEAQGFLFSHPVSVIEVGRLLAEQAVTVLAWRRTSRQDQPPATHATSPTGHHVMHSAASASLHS
jgi:EAL domain-containing protein (putative c-di-GMP-specific phosphodiesterase class I)